MYQGLIKVILLFIAGFAAADEVYRWQDEGGRWHFGGRQSAPEHAEPFFAAAPFSVVETSSRVQYRQALEEFDETKTQTKTKTRKSRKGTGGDRGVDVNDRERHKTYCDKWRDRMYKSRLGLRDHENQAAYERECILKVHW